MAECAVCHKPLRITPSTAYDDFYGDLCDDCFEEKVVGATVNPWTGKPI